MSPSTISPRGRSLLEFSVFDTSLLVVAVTAISAGAFIKGMTGVGLPLVAVPSIALFTSVEAAVVLMIIPTLGSNLWLVVKHRRHAALLADHKAFLVAGFFGSILGTVLLVNVDDRWLKLTLAAWLALYLVQAVSGNILRWVFQAQGTAATPVGMLAGAIQGATGVSAHIVAPYFHNRDLAPVAYAFLVACAFLAFSAAQLMTAAGTQLFTAERLAIGAIALIPTLIFTHAGTLLAGRISATLFSRLLIAIFVLMEIRLLADVFGLQTG